MDREQKMRYELGMLGHHFRPVRYTIRRRFAREQQLIQELRDADEAAREQRRQERHEARRRELGEPQSQSNESILPPPNENISSQENQQIFEHSQVPQNVNSPPIQPLESSENLQGTSLTRLNEFVANCARVWRSKARSNLLKKEGKRVNPQEIYSALQKIRESKRLEALLLEAYERAKASRIQAELEYDRLLSCTERSKYSQHGEGNQ
ncbi:unnamed protein product [Orchesella dallaii]|uniref:Uncharacterized protein n=1 Tax=Orchesella dallaii TaxID=48710 RepID=A0ABP1S099_9HEXA